MRIGYAPCSADLDQPGDRRRFCHYATRRGLSWERATPDDRYDAVVISPRADLLRWSRYDPRVPLVVDLADSYLAIPQNDLKARFRGTAKWIAGEARSPFFSYRSALEGVLRRADAVVSATPEQARAIRPLCSNVHPILDFQAEITGAVKTDYSVGRPVNLVWEGLGTNVRWFFEIAEVLRDLDTRHGIVLHVVTQLEYREFVMRFGRRRTLDELKDLGFDTRIYQWDVKTMGPICTACDIGVIPLPLDRPLQASKPENKLILLWRLGLPVVTSATPAYQRTMSEAGQELACQNREEWTATLGRLIVDEDARRRAGAEGREFATARYREDQLLEAWDAVFASVSVRTPTRS